MTDFLRGLFYVNTIDQFDYKIPTKAFYEYVLQFGITGLSVGLSQGKSVSAYKCYTGNSEGSVGMSSFYRGLN